MWDKNTESCALVAMLLGVGKWWVSINNMKIIYDWTLKLILSKVQFTCQQAENLKKLCENT